MEGIAAFRFGPFELQPNERRLLKDGVACPLRPRAFDLLTALVERAGHLVTKDELLDRVWPGVIVEEAALQMQVSSLRKALGPDAIVTISGHGYRFAMTVTRTEPPRVTPPPRTLPLYPTSFIEREHEGENLQKLLSRSRLVTLTGAGGAGKTRLAIETASRSGASYPDGVWLIELAAISDGGLVPQAVASSLGHKEQADRPLVETLADHLASKRLLLVLDNAEHLRVACASFADRLLRQCQGVTILTTSRERLGLIGEIVHRVPSLTVPEASHRGTAEALQTYESVRMFVERARLVRPHFAISAETAGPVAEICRRLDGIPLALELAAPHLRSMPIGEIARRLTQRFALLTGGSTTTAPRQRTVRSLIDWSYDLLSPDEQSLLTRLSVFAGGWTLEMAEQVCAGRGVERDNVLELLASLADKSLVLAHDADAAPRYRILETIREYASDRLREAGEDAHWHDTHFSRFTELAEEAFPELRGLQQKAWLDRLASDHDNFRRALNWSLAADPEGALRLAASFVRFWLLRSHLAEAAQWLRILLDSPSCPPRSSHRPSLLFAAGQLAILQGDPELSQHRYEQSLALSRDMDVPTWIAHALAGLGHLALERADYAQAETLLGEAVDVARPLGDRRLLAATLANLGTAIQARGDRAQARSVVEEALALVRDTGDRYAVAGKLHILSEIACEDGDLALGNAHAAESLAMFAEIGNGWGIAKALESLADLALAVHDVQRAAKCWGAAERWREETGARMRLDRQERHLQAVSATRRSLAAETFDAAWSEGRALSIEDMVRTAKAEATADAS